MAIAQLAVDLSSWLWIWLWIWLLIWLAVNMAGCEYGCESGCESQLAGCGSGCESGSVHLASCVNRLQLQRRLILPDVNPSIRQYAIAIRQSVTVTVNLQSVNPSPSIL